MLGQLVFYPLSDADRAGLGALRQAVFPAAVTTTHADGTATLHVFVPNPARPVWVRNGVHRGEPGEPGTWSSEAA